MKTRIHLLLALGCISLAASACDDTLTGPDLGGSKAATTTAAAALANPCSGTVDAKDPPPGWPVLYGTEGSDKMVAASGSVRMYGHGGDDCLLGGAGNDTLFGEAGDDYINVADGESDEVYGGQGDDTVAADDGAADIIDCGEGYDIVYADDVDILMGCEVVIAG